MLCYITNIYIYIYMSTTSPTISASQVMADEAAAEPAKPAEPVEPAVAPAAAEPAAAPEVNAASEAVWRTKPTKRVVYFRYD